MELVKMASLGAGTGSSKANPDTIYTEKEPEPEDQLEPSNHIAKRIQVGIRTFANSNSRVLWRVFLIVALILYFIYFAFALRYRIDGPAWALIVLTILSVLLIIYTFIRNFYGNVIWANCLGPTTQFFQTRWHCMKWFVIPLVAIAFLLVLALWIVTTIRQLQSIIGLVFLWFVLWITSKYPDRIRWRPVILGFALQFIMGIIVLRWKWGFTAINFLSKQITRFLAYTNDASASILGDPFFLLHPFIFVAMPMLIFFGAVMSILYYIGITQVVARKMGWFMQITLGTTAIESLSVAANIFLSGLDCMLMLRPYLGKLTKSEFCCFLTGNHSTVAGFAFAVFVLFGAPPEHLLSAAVMSAPAAIACSKLSYPETEESEFKDAGNFALQKPDEINIVEAGANGASAAGATVVAVVVNMIAVIAILTFINATLGWLGARIGIGEPTGPLLSFQMICSYIFMPLALAMGVENVAQAHKVASLIGLKLFTSEILAYQEMGVMKDNGELTERTVAIATYALCGFSSLATAAIAVGVWNAVEPSKTKLMATMLFRVVACANVSCFMTACIAGLLHNEDIINESTPEEERQNKILKDILGLIPSFKDLIPD